MEVFLVRSANPALSGYPIHGVFTDASAADAAMDAFEEAEKLHLQSRWKDDWKHFTSTFFVDTFTANIPVADLIAEKYDLKS